MQLRQTIHPEIELINQTSIIICLLSFQQNPITNYLLVSAFTFQHLTEFTCTLLHEETKTTLAKH